MNSTAWAVSAASHDVVVAGDVAAVADVVRDGAGEEHRLLRDEADLRAQVLLGHVAHVDAVHEDASAVHVVEARDQADERRLARARAADDGGHLSRQRREADVAQGGQLGAVIVEAHVLELHVALAVAVGLARRRRIVDLRFHVQHLVDADRRGLGAGDHDDHEARHEQREENLHRVLEEGHHVADVRGALVHADRAEPDDPDRRSCSSRTS